MKEYRRANGLCFKCGEKYSPTHQCAVQAQLKALKVVTADTLLSDDLLSAVAAMEGQTPTEAHFVSLHALSGSEDSKCIKLRALMGNQVFLLLVDLGSSHSFLNTAMVDKSPHLMLK